MKLSIVGAAAFGAFLAAPCVAYADGVVSAAPPAPAPACDFYENQLIGVLCARSAYVGTSVEDRQDINRLNINASGLAAYAEKDDSTWLTPAGILSVTPTDWLRITVNSSYNQNYYTAYITSPELVGAFPYYSIATVSQRIKTSQSNVAWQSVEGEANILDRQVDAIRYNIDVIAAFDFFPDLSSASFSSSTQRREEDAVLQAGARWTPWQSAYSISLLAAAGLHYYDNPDVAMYSYSARLLFSADDLGLAMGPTIDSSGFFSAQFYGFQGLGNYYVFPIPSAPFVSSHFGVAVLAEPFRKSHVAFLKDVTFEGSALRSIGQAAFQPVVQGKVSETIVAGTLRFNFNY